MFRISIFAIFVITVYSLQGQQISFSRLLNDTSMTNGSVSFVIRDAKTGDVIFDHDGSKSLSQASVMKLITSAAALELLGPDHVFTTRIGYTGKINRTGILNGNIIIKGGGDPALGSERFADNYDKFMDNWADEIQKSGIKKIRGRVIADDSYFDYKPVPPKWNWEDMGNYYGAGVYGISIFDNTFKLHFRTGDEGSKPVLTAFETYGYDITYINNLLSSGTTDEGYVYAAPYGNSGWITGTIPVNKNDFILKASMPDPPQITATLLDGTLRKRGIAVKLEPTVTRKQNQSVAEGITLISSTDSPPLSEIIEELNHESVNLYAEHLLKELGKVMKGDGSTAAGIGIIKHFLDSLGVDSEGMYIEDGSGLSPQDAINSAGLSFMLFSMEKNGRYFNQYLNSLPEAGKEGTLKNYFKDPVFEGAMKAKSGSFLRVRSYAGYIIAKSGKNLIFCIIVNNYSDPSSRIVSHIEDILKESILNN